MSREPIHASAPMLSDEDLHYWGSQFVRRGLARYMDFDRFVRDPRRHLAAIEAGDFRPLLPEQRGVRDRLESLDDVGELHGDRVIEPMRHHSYAHNPRSKELRHANRNR